MFEKSLGDFRLKVSFILVKYLTIYFTILQAYY